VVRFSVKQELVEGLFLRGSEIISRTKDGENVLLQRNEMKLRGLHNVENVLAALAAGLACGAAPASMRETLKSFEPVEHRLEFVSELQGVKFYNDSKATSVDATLKALEAFAAEAGKITLILGGRGKGAPYLPLATLIRDKARKLVLIGEDAQTIADELGEFAETVFAGNMEEAVMLSFQTAQPGDIVLLAPACASFDMFDSFEHRGRVFKEEVSSLEFRVSSSEPNQNSANVEPQTSNSKLETRNSKPE
jgi:UDP-N-acetylmuramoylalanine--D-glutamate ligase